MKTIQAADLFCGAGGTSTGLYLAAQELGYNLSLLAVNHWEVAIATHRANHPEATHLCEDLDNVNPRKVVPGGYLDLLVASPECTHHSRARGGKPISDQSRASAFHVLRWAEALNIRNILIENVSEFRGWGPLDEDGKQIERLKGKTYLAFLQTLRSLGYHVSERVLNCADYGDPTTRKRLFIQARKGKRVRWPAQSHSQDGAPTMFGKKERWKSARGIIDWSIEGESIFSRKKPLKENTMRRIAAGLRKYSGLPFVIGQQSGAAPRAIDQPIPTIAGAGAISLIEPFLIEYHGSSYEGGERVRDLDRPFPTVATINQFGLVKPFLVMLNGTSDKQLDSCSRSIDDPLPAVTTIPHAGLVEPFIVATNHGKDYRRSYPLDNPFPTVTSVDAWGLVEPFIVKYNGTGGACSIDEPLDTITGKDRFGLVIPLANGERALLDIRFRMLKPHELAAAMSFPDDYAFFGNREKIVKQIGNAVPVLTAAALCRQLLS